MVQLRDLADGATGEHRPVQVAEPVDVVVRIEPLPTVGPLRPDDAIATLPGPDEVSAESGPLCDNPYRVEHPAGHSSISMLLRRQKIRRQRASVNVVQQNSLTNIGRGSRFPA